MYKTFVVVDNDDSSATTTISYTVNSPPSRPSRLPAPRLQDTLERPCLGRQAGYTASPAPR